jgi:hypothetical protein
LGEVHSRETLLLQSASSLDTQEDQRRLSLGAAKLDIGPVKSIVERFGLVYEEDRFRTEDVAILGTR